MLVQHSFGRSAERLGDKEALIAGQVRLSYAQLREHARSLAAFLRVRGVLKGDRVALYLDNRPEFAAAMLATLECGAVFVPINPQTKRDKLARLLQDCEPRAVFTEWSLLSTLTAVDSNLAGLVCIVCTGTHPSGSQTPLELAVDFAQARASAPDCRPEPSGIDADLAALIYTSGSTGDSKGVMLTHLNMVSAMRSIVEYLRLRESDVIFCALPLSFDYGLYQLLLGFEVGATIVLEPSFAFASQAMDVVARERVTVFPGVPTMFSMLSNLRNLSQKDLSNVRLATNTAAALPERMILEIGRMFPQAEFYSMYGLTECKRVSYLPPQELGRRPTSIGRGMPNQELWLVDPDGQRLPPGTTGELVVRGSHVMRGYWRRPEATRERLRPGPIEGERVLYTGDIFRSDEEGFLYFLGRKDDIIKCRGEKVSPREVENVLSTLPGVLECAVIGVPDALLGQAVKALVVCRAGCEYSAKDVIRHCALALEPHMVPKHVEFFAALPRSPNGKVNVRGM
jgi:amino acid adenylation domain-containing protein